MLTKYIEADAYFVTPAKAKHCNGTCDWLEKEASVTHESVEYFNNLTPKPDHIYVLTVAMTSGEYYSSNKNGDYFREQDLKKMYKGFENAGVFWNHDNKDMNKSSGKVLKSFFNDKMHRIELIIEIHKDKARYIPNYIAENKPISVSMGLRVPCFRIGTHVTMSDGASKPIEDIKIGDKVLTTQGNSKEVVATSRTHFVGEMCEITPNVGNKVTCTYDHKFLVVDFRKLGYNKKQVRLQEIVNLIKKQKNIESIMEWVEAGKLDKNKHLLTQTIRNKNIEFLDIINESTARLLGYYLAEGHIMKSSKRDGSGVKNAGIVLSCYKDDMAVKEIEKLVKDSNVSINNYTITKSNTSDKVRIISIYSRELGDLALEYCGQYAKTKKLSEKIFSWPDNLKKHFIGAYIDGDGLFNTTKSHYGHASISTASESLALQVQKLLYSIGIQSSKNRLNHKPSGKVKKYTVEYTITIGKHDSQKLFGFCSKIFKINIDNTKNHSTRRKFVNNYAFTLIKKIDKFHSEEFVYNIQVKDDQTYIVEDINTHNCELCSICGHVTKGSYANRCHHLKYQMNQVLDDGRKVYAISGEDSKIFDISFVFRPADRIAYALYTKTGN